MTRSGDCCGLSSSNHNSVNPLQFLTSCSSSGKRKLPDKPLTVFKITVGVEFKDRAGWTSVIKSNGRDTAKIQACWNGLLRTSPQPFQRENSSRLPSCPPGPFCPKTKLRLPRRLLVKSLSSTHHTTIGSFWENRKRLTCSEEERKKRMLGFSALISETLLAL